MNEAETAKQATPAAAQTHDDISSLPTIDVTPDSTSAATQTASASAAPRDNPATSTSFLENSTPAVRSIGPYRLIRKLGEGGFGQVWLAEQIAPLRRQVALKLIRTGMYDDAGLKRFQSERQSLAIMDHPSTARVFDAGATPDGQPYFVMEKVEWSGISRSNPSRLNQRNAKCIRTSSIKRLSLVIPYR